MIQSNTSNTREDLEKDNAKLQKENWEFRNQLKVGCSNTDHNSLYFQLERSKNESLRFQQEINNLNQNLNLILKKIETLTKENESLKQQLDSLESKVNEQTLEINDKVSKSEIETCKQEILLLKYKSKYKSDIIDKLSFKIINEWIDDVKTMDFELIYHASNNFEKSSFHSACDGKGATITLIETLDGCVFGGYNSQSWNSDGNWHGDDKCFIFTLVNKHGIKPTKYSPRKELKKKKYVASNICSGPLFGRGYDIGIGTINGSHQSFPFTFVDTTGKGKSTLTPTKFFTIKTIEIYKCI
ncbi:hypothetical protein CYY_006047 [Polysphondylium violaceum]|uniref:TLDc domain-containing protein n=1 Tax=Polysphondylium violaceum TaxID=133409 RepID=A0A8J4UYE9_9MYCE|nr:hypothetical protein CYY_006047 [Polysphondylium violaceum]